MVLKTKNGILQVFYGIIYVVICWVQSLLRLVFCSGLFCGGLIKLDTTNKKIYPFLPSKSNGGDFLVSKALKFKDLANNATSFIHESIVFDNLQQCLWRGLQGRVERR